MVGISIEVLRPVFEKFRRDPGSRLTVRMRQERAGQLRELLSDPEAVDLATFNNEVWVHDSGTYLRKDGVRKRINEVRLEELAAGFDAGNVKFHGNNIWGSAARIYGSNLKSSGKDKLSNIGRALHILNNSSLSAMEKARLIDEIPGFGENISTGLVMVFHPDSFAIYNRRSKGGVEKLGRDAHSLEAFEDSVRRLREDLGAEDFLELDWFLYQINEGSIEVPKPSLGEERGNKITTDRGPLNVILHGPPGTGKTYSVQRRALEIVKAGSMKGLSSAEVGAAFREHRARGRIEFVTFHPSYSYEEFVEGFRYDPDKQVPTLHKGLFQNFADNAANPRGDLAPTEGATIWKVSLGPAHEQWVFDRCMANNEIAVGWLEGINLSDADNESLDELFKEHHPGASKKSVDYLVNGIRPGDYVAVFGSLRTIRAIGVITGDYTFKGNEYDHYHHTRPVEWLDRREHDIVEMNGNTELTLQTIYELWRIPLQDFVELVPNGGEAEEPHVLVIDEINRGNISRVFGELITLLEPDKRRGASNELSARLPYSGRTFTVPSNLYVIGTMNTADRSIALLDVALRRRLEFEELMPDVSIVRRELENNSDLSAEQVDLICEFFDILNARIVTLLDRDHQIGHSYLLGLSSMGDLCDALYRRVFPLLQEYFYNDHERLERLLGVYDAVQGTGFIERPTVEYGRGFTRDDVDEKPWKFHQYDTSELEAALRETFIGG